MKVSTTRLEKEEAKIIYQETAGLAIITIRRPQAKNALTANMWQQLRTIALQTLENPKNKVLIIRGYGESFTAGAGFKKINLVFGLKRERGIFDCEGTAFSNIRVSPPSH